MSILFSCICNQPERLHTAIEPVRSALVATNIARWGLGYVQSGEVLLSRHPRAVDGPFDFYNVVRELRSDYIIGCAAREDGYQGTTNTQPYRFQHWMFAQEDTIADFAPSAARLDEVLPGFLRRSIKGKTPAEYVFHVFLSLLHDAGQVQDYNVDPSRTAVTLRKAIKLVSETIGPEMASGLGNLMVTNSRSLLAVRLQKPLFLRHLRQQEDPKRPDTEFRSAFVLSTAEHPGQGFEELPERSVLCISRDVTSDIQQLDVVTASA